MVPQLINHRGTLSSSLPDRAVIRRSQRPTYSRIKTRSNVGPEPDCFGGLRLQHLYTSAIKTTSA